MSTSRCCSLCKQSGHNIRKCNDIRIVQTWKTILTHVDLLLGIHVTMEDLALVKDYLYVLDRPLLRAIGCQIVKTNMRDSIETHIEKLSYHIMEIVESVAFMPTGERNRFLHWVDPEKYNFYTLDSNEDDEINFWENQDEEVIENINVNLDSEFMVFEEPVEPFHPVIEPTILCLETAEELSQMIECAICYDESKKIDMVITNCGHEFCYSCICKHADSKISQASCPMCRSTIFSLEVKEIQKYDEIVEKYNEVSSILKDCYLLKYGNLDLLKGSYVDQIEFLLLECGNEWLSKEVFEADTMINEVKPIWRFIYFESNRKNGEDEEPLSNEPDPESNETWNLVRLVESQIPPAYDINRLSFSSRLDRVH